VTAVASAAPPAPAPEPPRRRGTRRRPPAWWVHLPFAAVVIIGLVPRLLAMLGYQPILFFFGDSYAYLVAAQNAEPPGTRPFGYAAFLRLMAWTDQLWLVALVQHVAILVLAVVLYRWLLRRGAPIWLAAIVPTPMLLDGYQVLTEHLALTETLFVILLLGAALLVMRDPLPTSWAAVAGGMVAYASLTRTVAVPLIALFVAYLCVRHVGRRKVAALVLAFSIPLLGYAAWYQSVRDAFALQQDGRFLYARVAPFADCARMTLTPKIEPLCDPALPATRPSPNFYAWDSLSPLATAELPDGVDRQEAARAFAREAILSQPWDYARTVIGDTAQYFVAGRSYGRLDTPPSWWNFPEVPARPGQQLALSGSGFANDSVTVRLDPGIADVLRGWQRNLGTQGPLLLAGLLLALVGAGYGRSRRGGVQRADALLLAGLGLGLLVLASATSVFDYRYGVPAAPFLYLGGGVGALLLRQRRAPVVDAVASKPLREGARWSARRSERATPAWRHPAAARTAIAALVVATVAAVAWAPMEPHPIYPRYVATGAERGTLGYPTSDELAVAGAPGWAERRFVGGSVFASPVPRTYVLDAATTAAYSDQAVRTRLGLPVSSTQVFTASQGESVTWFADGALAVSGPRGLRSVVPPLLAGWCRPKEKCALGVPLAEASTSSEGVVLQQFERGVLIKRPGEPIERVLIPATQRPGSRDTVAEDDRGAGAL
jgi:hypothetical protein